MAQHPEVGPRGVGEALVAALAGPVLPLRQPDRVARREAGGGEDGDAGDERVGGGLGFLAGLRVEVDNRLAAEDGDAVVRLLHVRVDAPGPVSIREDAQRLHVVGGDAFGGEPGLQAPQAGGCGPRQPFGPVRTLSLDESGRGREGAQRQDEEQRKNFLHFFSFGTVARLR
jgi:hypothetical protein